VEIPLDAGSDTIRPLTALTDDERLFFDEVEKFARSKIGPRVLAMDEAERMDPEILKQMFELGFMGIEVPTDYGGAGGTFMMAILAIQALARVDPSVSVVCDVQNTLVNNIFLRWGSKEQRAKYLPRLTGSEIGSYCLTEANSGSDAFAMKARAVDAGSEWRLTGKKIFITNAKEASVFVVFANVNPEQGYKGITAFVVEKGTPGLSLGKKEVKLGIRASSTCEVILEDVRIPKANVIGELGKGYKIAIETLNEGRIGIASQMLGLAEGALAGAVAYARQREQFGKPLREFQGIQMTLGELAAKVEAARLLVYNAARLKDAGLPFVKEAAMAKYMVSMIAEEVASRALEIYGGYGFIKEFPAEKFYRDAKIGKLYEGTSNMQLMTIFKAIDQ
jgi:alkylation response protein AidB-like acyl-CoA dehydrogenase